MNERNRYAILLINGVPYAFHSGWIESENITYSNSIQLSTKKDGIPIITPETAVANLTIRIPMEKARDKAIYKIAKEVIRSTQHIFATSNSETTITEDGNELYTGKQTLTIPFTKLEVPWEVQVSCAYFGLGIQMACCVLQDFSVSTYPLRSGFTEVWSIGLTEYSFRRVDEEFKDPSNIQKDLSNTLTEPTNMGKTVEFETDWFGQEYVK